MYIRRKVFSILTDEVGEERLFSTNDILLEKDFAEKAVWPNKGNSINTGFESRDQLNRMLNGRNLTPERRKLVLKAAKMRSLRLAEDYRKESGDNNILRNIKLMKDLVVQVPKQ